jgi:hypothetical protein
MEGSDPSRRRRRYRRCRWARCSTQRRCRHRVRVSQGVRTRRDRLVGCLLGPGYRGFELEGRWGHHFERRSVSDSGMDDDSGSILEQLGSMADKPIDPYAFLSASCSGVFDDTMVQDSLSQCLSVPSGTAFASNTRNTPHKSI